MHELLQELKNHLDITFDDIQYDTKLLSLLNMGAAYLQKRIAPEIDFINDNYLKQLLFEYVRYSLAGAINDFNKNYAVEILSLKTYEDVNDYDKTE